VFVSASDAEDVSAEPSEAEVDKSAGVSQPDIPEVLSANPLNGQKFYRAAPRLPECILRQRAALTEFRKLQAVTFQGRKTHGVLHCLEIVFTVT